MLELILNIIYFCFRQWLLLPKSHCRCITLSDILSEKNMIFVTIWLYHEMYATWNRKFSIIFFFLQQIKYKILFVDIKKVIKEHLIDKLIFFLLKNEFYRSTAISCYFLFTIYRIIPALLLSELFSFYLYSSIADKLNMRHNKGC